MAKRTVGIVGAGVSGLLACKHALHVGLHPMVFEAESGIGGVWYRTIRTTKLQSPKFFYQFLGFPWPEEVEYFPAAKRVFEYIESYAQHFDLLRHIRFQSRVVAVDYVGVSEEEMESWALWSGNGEAFGVGGKGRWQLTVEHSGSGSEVYEVDFLILCLGRFSGLPNIPSFPPNRSPQVFHGKVLHSMDFSNLDDSTAIELLKGKRTVVVGYSKSAVDIAAECSDANGPTNPCTLIWRETKWVLPGYKAWGIPIAFLYLTRLSELTAHKPGEGPLLSILATLLSPMRWLASKFVESYVKWKVPVISKHGLVPNHSFAEGITASRIATSPERFYERIGEGSIIPKMSKGLGFCEKGVIADDGEVIEAEVVILATGYRGKDKIRNMFSSPTLKKIVLGSPSIAAPLYRGCINPRIPQLTIVGYCQSLSDLSTSEMRCIWLMHFLDGRFQLPEIRKMEEDTFKWQEYMKRYCRNVSSFPTLQNWYDEQLFKDIGFDPTRKLGLLRWFLPLFPDAYEELLTK